MRDYRKLIDKKVIITDRESMYYKDWGTIIAYDGDYFHVAIADGDDTVPVFERNQFKIYMQSITKI